MNKFRIIQFTYMNSSPDPWTVTYFENLKELLDYAKKMKVEFPCDLFVYQIMNEQRYRTFGWSKD